MQFLQSVAQFFSAVGEVIGGVIASFRINDLLDILLVAFLVYKGIQLVKETRAAQLLKGILLLCVVLVVSNLLDLKTINILLNYIFNFGLVAIVVLFQPELRRALERVGRTKVSGRRLSNLFSGKSEEEQNIRRWEKAINTIASAAESLSKTKTGALIVFERQSKLGEQIATGVEINADISEELIGNIFFKNSPLHDGAMIIRDARILAASCFLPKPEKEELIARELGSRHRAAIGMSENSDAVILVVSEETGAISVAENGEIIRHLTKEQLVDYLTSRIIPEQPVEHKKSRTRREKKQ
ncbi:MULTISPECIES: diadenylate cyclase CdaA [Clostridiaceae]|uniref:Diadenylate cyclase n=1 Tax=Clostridium facile TaxID=2763035 RepID=A0ABR7IMV3_9CLOT|nr:MULTISPECIES: diadenylate cyclase CdaA [Clostridiaceae]MBC5786457.1 TIGR00159 family protein [Clostridium facile]PWM99479.1 MAG: TIGR00159 family protein [Massilioclostridium sp.]